MRKKVKLLEQFLEEGLFDVVTQSKAFIKNPISATKITNNGKKLAQAEVDSAANDLDFEKRKLAASKAAKQKIEALKKKGDDQGAKKVQDEFSDNKEVLSKAHDQKSDALTDKVAGIKDRIDDLSKKNSSLQDLASLVKTAARVKKNEVLFKGADDEEKKQLKLTMKQDIEKIKGIQKGFGDYEGSDEPEDKAPKDKKKDDVTVDTGDRESGKPAAKGTPPPPPPAQPAAKTTTSEPAGKTDKSTAEKPEDKVRTARADLADAQRNMADAQRRVKDLDDKINNLKAGKYDKKTITDPKAEIASLEDQKKKAEARVEDTKADVEFTSAEADKAEKAFTASKEGKPEPKAEAPKAEAPKADKPEVKVPPPPAKKEAPKAEAPKTDKPEVKVPPPPKKKSDDEEKKQAAESLTTLKSFKDFVNEKKFSQKS